MYLSRINVTMPKHSEAIARMFYSELLGLRELRRPDGVDVRGGVWFDAGGLPCIVPRQHKARPA